MNSPTHTLLAMALLSKSGKPVRNWAIAIGSLIPDIAIYIWAPWQMWINDVGRRTLWRELYFEDTMQAIIAPPNSIPLFALLAGIGFWLNASGRSLKWGLALLMLSLAALIHIATDIPVHSHDAYRHLWPLSDWRFHSPISYWQDSRGGRWISMIEAAIGLACAIVLWRRHPRLWVKLTLGLLGLAYIALQLKMWLDPFGGPP